MTKGLIVNVLRNDLLTSDCTNGGVSSKNKVFLLVGDGVDGWMDSETSDLPVLKLVRRDIGGRNHSSEYLHVEPLTQGNRVWYMAGGNFCWSSDSRFPCDYPLSIHDRVE